MLFCHEFIALQHRDASFNTPSINAIGWKNTPT
jgi:hypothetical protein